MKEERFYWSDSEQVQSILRVDDQNRSHGKQWGWHRNGYPWWEENYTHGRKHGVFVMYSEKARGMETTKDIYFNDEKVREDEFRTLVDENGANDIDTVRLDELLAMDAFEGIARRQFAMFLVNHREEMIDILKAGSVKADLECPLCCGEFSVTLERNDG